MQHIRFHDLRRSAATNMFALTGDILTISTILGHSLKGTSYLVGTSFQPASATPLYVDVTMQSKKRVLDIYHKALLA